MSFYINTVTVMFVLCIVFTPFEPDATPPSVSNFITLSAADYWAMIFEYEEIRLEDKLNFKTCYITGCICTHCQICFVSSNSHTLELTSLCCNGRRSTSVICNAQQLQQWLDCPFLDVVPPWSMQSSSATTIIRLSSTVPCIMIFGCVSWRQTWPNHDNLHCSTVDNKSSWHPARTLTCCHTYSFVLCSLYDMPSILL